MSGEIVFYTHPMSRGRIARWMLEEVGCPYRTEILGFGAPMKGDYRRINPMGKVPAIQHGEVVVTEAAAICLYLADAFPEAGLAPAPGHSDRAPYYRWMLFAAGPLESAITNRTLGVTPSDNQKGFVGYGDYDTTVGTLEAHLAHSDYATGPTFTAVDVYLGAQVSWGLQFGNLDARPAFEAYRDRLTKREAFLRASGLDDELLRSGTPA